MMFNPFQILTSELLEAFVSRGKTYFVRQQFPRGKQSFDTGVKGYFLFSHYDNLTTALDHFGAISYDRTRFLYKWEVAEHRQKLRLAASGLKEYRIYAAVFKTDWEKQNASRMRDKLRMYIKKLGWNPHRDEGVLTNYEIQFGELFIRIKHQGREVKVKFEEVEKMF